MGLEQHLQNYVKISQQKNHSGYDKKPSDVYGEIVEKMNQGDYPLQELQDYFEHLMGRESDFPSENFDQVPVVLPWTTADYVASGGNGMKVYSWGRTQTQARYEAIAKGCQFPVVMAGQSFRKLYLESND